MEQFEKLISYAEYLITQDETELALKALECLPAYDRDHRPVIVEQFKNKVLHQILMPHDLMMDQREIPKSIEHSLQYLRGTARGMVLRKELADANLNGITPCLVDFGPGDFCFAIALHHLGLQFKYCPITLNKKAEADCAEILKDKMVSSVGDLPYWFLAYEIIEHLPNVSDIKTWHNRYGQATKVFLSTPKYCYGTGSVRWKEEGIHHLRAYTPPEFFKAAIELFPEFEFQYVDNEVMVLIGNRQLTP